MDWWLAEHILGVGVVVEGVGGRLCVVRLIPLVSIRQGVAGAVESAWSKIGWGGAELNRREERRGGECSRAPAEDWGGIGLKLQRGGGGR